VPADLTIEPAQAAIPAVPVKPAVSQAAPSPPVAGSASPLLPNPRLTVDPGLNRVVLEFFDSAGTLTNTIPSQKQLDAYRLAASSGQPATVT